MKRPDLSIYNHKNNKTRDRSFMQTKEYREKMSRIAKGKNTWSKGRVMSKEEIERRKLSIPRGEKHWNWGGKDKNPNFSGGKTRYWKQRALERDNFTCQKCFISDKEVVEVDHIKSKSLFPELRFSLSNLITLCANCHRKKTLEDIRNKAIKFRRKRLLQA